MEIDRKARITSVSFCFLDKAWRFANDLPIVDAARSRSMPTIPLDVAEEEEEEVRGAVRHRRGCDDTLLID